MNFSFALANRDKRCLFVYGRHERAVQGMHEFFQRVKDDGATLHMASRVVRFPEGGLAKFCHVDDELRGHEIDSYEVDAAVANRLDGTPLLTLLATRKREVI